MPTEVPSIILTAIQHDKDTPSGAARIAFDVACYLAHKGCEVWVVAPAVSADSREHEIVNGVNLLRYRVPRFHPLNPQRGWAHQTATKELLRRYVGGPVKAVHGHAPLSYLAACELYAHNARTCYTVHSPVAKEMDLTWSTGGFYNWTRRIAGLYWLNRIERSCLEKSDSITVLSEFTKGQLDKIHGTELTHKIEIIPGGVDLERFRIIEDRQRAKRELGWPEDVPIFFTLRRLVPRMGLQPLLRACKTIRDGGHKFRLLLGGTGPLHSSLQQIVADLDLGQQVQFLGHVDDAILPVMYGACDAFVLPTAALECFGLIAVEALACGRPVLATPVGAIPEILNRVEPRWMARSADEYAIADLLSSFLRCNLPTHSAPEVRSVVKCHYDSGSVVPRLGDFVLGQVN